MTTEDLNKVREAVACLDEAILLIPLAGISRGRLKLRNRFQDAAHGLTEVREEIQVQLQVRENLKKAMK